MKLAQALELREQQVPLEPQVLLVQQVQLERQEQLVQLRWQTMLELLV